MNHSRSLLLALIASLAASAAVAAPLAANANDTTPATWAEHVAPILYENCASCHRPGQTAPMSLLSYDEARPWAKSIRNVTTERTMPPWFADPEHGEFVEDPSLTDSEIDALTRWVAAGAPAGDLSKAPEPPSFSSEWKLGQPDAVFVAPEYEVSDDVEYQETEEDKAGDGDYRLLSKGTTVELGEAIHWDGCHSRIIAFIRGEFVGFFAVWKPVRPGGNPRCPTCDP